MMNRHLGHMVEQDEWRRLVGAQDMFDYTEKRGSKVVTQMLRHGKACTGWSMSALGYGSMVEVLNLVHGSRGHQERIDEYGEQSGVTPQNLVGFLRTDKCRFFVIGKREVGATQWTPWMVRCIDGAFYIGRRC